MTYEDLKARLRYTIAHGLFAAAKVDMAVSYAEALAAIERLEADNAKLREALGEIWEWIGNWSPDFIWGNDNPPLELTAAFTRHRVAVVGLITDWLINARFMNVTATEIETRFGATRGIKMEPAGPVFDAVTVIAPAVLDEAAKAIRKTHVGDEATAIRALKTRYE